MPNERKKLKLCNNDCANCPMTHHENARMITFILGKIVNQFPNADNIIQRYCPNLSVCPECRVDDFVHCEDCKLGAE